MKMLYTGIRRIAGPLLFLSSVPGVGYDHLAEITTPEGEIRRGRVIAISEEFLCLQVFEGTAGLGKTQTSVSFTGRPLTLPLSGELLGRSFDGGGRPIDGLGPIFPEERREIGGSPLNPLSREYPRNCIYTGISAIDCAITLIRGQKLPIFSGAGLPHNQLAAQILRQARVEDGDSPFAIVFAAMGVGHDVAAYFQENFQKAGVLHRVSMFLNLASHPIVERLLTPRLALTAAEYLAFTRGYHVLVILTDMAAYCEALREYAASKGDIPSRRAFPSYMYSDLASLYERAGILRNHPGSLTLMPILSMPGDDISHPIPDLTGYITEGQIVLSRDLHLGGVYPPVAILESLSRLMKDGIGEGRTRPHHPQLANQLFSCYARVREARSLESLLGHDELSPLDQKYIEFGRGLEGEFLAQNHGESRSLDQSLTILLNLFRLLPRSELNRLDKALLDQYHHEDIPHDKTSAHQS